jgi:hypothetical protein
MASRVPHFMRVTLPAWLAAMLLVSCASHASEAPKKQYWATSLSGAVQANLLQGLHAAVARGEVGWLDVDPQHALPEDLRGINLVFYHVGGNCYIDSDCDRFPSSEDTNDQWSKTERAIDLDDSATRKIVIDDLVSLMQLADHLAPKSSVIGIHVDNVHRLTAEGLAELFNEYLRAIEVAKLSGRISKNRIVGYVAKNNPSGFMQALDQRLLRAAPLYQINENARLHEDGSLNGASRVAQEIGSRYGIPVFLKTFGSDIAYKIEEDGASHDLFVSPDMTARMADLAAIAGAAWSSDERRYHPTLFFQGAAVGPVRYGSDERPRE